MGQQHRWGNTLRMGFQVWGSLLAPRRQFHRTELSQCRTHRCDKALVSICPGCHNAVRLVHS